MLGAAAAAQLPVRWNKREHRLRFRNSLFALLVPLALMIIGISILPD